MVSSRQIFTSSSNHRRLQRAAEYLGRLLGSSEVLVLAPTRSAADDFVRGCWRDQGPFYGVHRLTPIHLAVSLATAHLARARLAPISRLGIEALAARSVYECRQRLVYFAPVADTPGFARALASTLNELRMEGVMSDRLASTGAPGKDLARLLTCYENELAARRLADLALILHFATEVARHATHRLLGLPTLLLDIPLDSASERTCMTALCQRSPAVAATGLVADVGSVATLENMLGVKAENLDSTVWGESVRDQSTRVSAVAPDGESETSLERLRPYLFSADVPPPGKLDGSLDFFSAPGEALECVEVARCIRSAAEAGIGFDQMAILLRDPDSYLPLVEDALRRAGVPGYFTGGIIRPDPSGRAFLALLDCAADGLSASKFSEYLSLGQVPIVDDSGGPPQPKGTWVAPEDELQFSFRFPPPEPSVMTSSGSEGSDLQSVVSYVGPAPAVNQLCLFTPVADSRHGDTAASDSEATSGEGNAERETDQSPVIEGTLRAPFGWERFLIDAAVIGGKDRWSRRLRGLEAEYQMQIEDLKGRDESRREHVEKQLERLKHLQHFALPVIDCLDSLPKAARWGDWLDKLRMLAEMALRQPECVLSALSELQPMDAVGPVGLSEVRQVLTERLSFLRREPPLRRYGRVFVGSIGEVSARSFEIVFLPGLAEGLFPRPAFEDALLLDQYRPQLGGLTTREKRLGRERLLLRIAAGAASSRLCVSYPKIGVAEGRSRVPSFYALEVLRAAEGRLPALAELEKRAAKASQSRLGWPAPKEAGDAIDDAEHDLAVLDNLIHQPRKEVKGRARYLMTVSPPLARSLRTRRDRWSKQWSSADGIVDPDQSTLQILATQRVTARTYSPSALQHYAACPYRFLLYAVHQLHEREEALPVEKMDPLTRGALFHGAQFELFRELDRSGLLPVVADMLDRTLEIADRVLDRVAADYEERLAPAIPQVWRTEIEGLRTDVRGWIHQLVSIHAKWVPIHFEYAFGLPLGLERDPASSPGQAVILDGLRLRGSIDLIEKHRTRNVLRVTDHKTGKAPDPLPVSVAGGEVLQPLLYGLTVECLLGQEVESGVLFYCTQRGGYASASIPLDEKGRMRIREVIASIDEAVEKGFLPAAPNKDACSRCDYRMVCGPYEERRVKLKPADRLEALQKLRCQP